ncbi:MAG: mevalonate kinase [Methanosarcinales archaeon]|nr:mevalonate kinase [Methanosarcinales archaeon]
MTEAKASGKVYLFGEHAVVYGQEAICAAIDLTTTVRVRQSNTISINSKLGNTGIDYSIHPYVSAAIEAMIPEGTGIEVIIESELPVGSGLGSSAAVTIATLCALNREFDKGLTKIEIAKTGAEVEKKIQGSASPTDTYVSTFGGVIAISKKQQLPVPDYSIVIGNTNEFSSTRKLVTDVAKLKDAHPDIINPIIDDIGDIARQGIGLVQNNDYNAIGRLMNVNHGLLDAIGVGTCKLSELVYAARKAGAYGAKITGAGGGGCMFAICDNPEAVAESITDAGGDAIITHIRKTGVE